jgi:hypothetical protein
MEAIRSSETSVNARSTRRHIPEDDILQVNTVLLLSLQRWEMFYRRNTNEDGSLELCVFRKYEGWHTQGKKGLKKE